MSILEHEIEIIIAIHTHITSNFKTRIRIADYVSIYNISESILTRGFKFLYKKSIYQYRLEKSMQYAKILLDSGAQVKVVTRELGYKSPGSFSRAYKKVHILPPGKSVFKLSH